MARARTRDTTPRPPKARSDAWVGLLALALVAQIAGAVFLFLDYNSYGQMTPPKVAGPPAAPATTPPAGGQQGGQMQGGQMQGGQMQGGQAMGNPPPMP